MPINGHTALIAHLGWPTHSFKAPMIYNPYFESVGVNAVVMPMGCRPEHFAGVLRGVFALENTRGALITMPHKVRVVELCDVVSPVAAVAGSCNAVRKTGDGRLVGDMFDGVGFVRGLQRKGLALEGRRALVVGAGGVGSAIAASLAHAGVGTLALHDVNRESVEGLAVRLARHFPAVEVATGDADPAGFDLVVNATPLGMAPADPLPVDVSRLAPGTFVGEVVMTTEMTPLLTAAQARGCRIQHGADMLFEMIPAYLEFFGYPVASPETLRSVAQLEYGA